MSNLQSPTRPRQPLISNTGQLFGNVLRAGILCTCLAAVAVAQLPTPPLSVQSIPVGQRPLGLDIVPPDPLNIGTLVVVANSGDNSVSILGFGPGIPFGASSLLTGIPSPYAVVCNGRVVTSPSDNSIRLIPLSRVIKPGVSVSLSAGTVKVGSQPFSATCISGTVFVSNYGDSSLSVVDANSLTVVRTIPSVPGSRSLGGISFGPGGLWVAGTDANVVTIVNPASGTVVASIPVHAPTIVSEGRVVSAADNSIMVFDSDLKLTSKISGIPTPQFMFGNLVSTGPGNSVISIAAIPPANFVSGIPGAAGITSTTLSGESVTFVTSPDTNSVYVIQNQNQPAIPSQFQIANGASFRTPVIAPGELASVITSTGISQNFFANSLPLPKTLGGLTLNMGGSLNFDASVGRWNYSSTGSIQAPLLFVGPNQINFQVPPGIPTTGASVAAQLVKPDGSTLLTPLYIAPTAPGIFTPLQNGQGQGAVLNQDNTQNFGTNPAKRGSVIQIFATGAGDTTPPLLPGEPAPANGNPLVLTNVQPTVTIGGQSARVLFSGMAPGFVGLWQINAEVPQNVTPGPAVPLVISAGGNTSNTVTIAVE